MAHKIKSSLHSQYYAEASGGIHLRDLAHGQHSSEETSQRWRAVGDTARFHRRVIEAQTYRTDNDAFKHYASRPVRTNYVYGSLMFLTVPKSYVVSWMLPKTAKHWPSRTGVAWQISVAWRVKVFDHCEADKTQFPIVLW